MSKLLKNHIGWIAIAVLAASASFYAYTFVTAMKVAEHSFGSGVFGDAFGVVNAAFTGLALLALGVSIYLQREELSEVRKERSLAQDTLDFQLKINETQANDLAARRNEDVFYRLLALVAEERKSHALAWRNYSGYCDVTFGAASKNLGNETKEETVHPVMEPLRAFYSYIAAANRVAKDIKDSGNDGGLLSDFSRSPLTFLALPSSRHL